jgi:hypothetical protein
MLQAASKRLEAVFDRQLKKLELFGEGTETSPLKKSVRPESPGRTLLYLFYVN